MVRTPKYLIYINGTDTTDVIFDKLISMSIVDNANNESDELDISVSGNFTRPKYEDEIKVYLGYGIDVSLVGLYKVQRTSKNFTQLSISATSVDFSDSFKVKRHVTYENVSIKQIVSQVAARHGLEVKCDYDDLYVLSQAQTNESDMHFINRLAKEYNAIFNVKDKTLYFVKKIKDGGKSEDLPRYGIDVNYCSSINIEHSNTTLYNSCEVSWHDTKENKTIKRYYPKSAEEPILKLRGSFKNEALAIERAKAQLEKANQGLIKGSLKKEGELIFAGGVVNLVNNIDLDSSEYQITKVTHNLSKQSGWTTTIDFES
ncbi:MAG TPA: hypothetical protein VJY14_04765 [Aliarcobacter sp.]|nr:hypothetical protein [Aliarcobacter sp.]